MTKSVRPPNWTSWWDARHKMAELLPDLWFRRSLAGDETFVRALRRGKIRCRDSGCREHSRSGLQEVPLEDVLRGLQNLTFFSDAVMAEFEIVEVQQRFTTLGWVVTSHAPLKLTRTRTVWIKCPELVLSDLRSDLVEWALPASAIPPGDERKNPGTKPRLRNAVTQIMLRQLTREEITVEELKAYTFKQLKNSFDCSANTANAARKEAISEFLILNNSEY